MQKIKTSIYPLGGLPIASLLPAGYQPAHYIETWEKGPYISLGEFDIDLRTMRIRMQAEILNAAMVFNLFGSDERAWFVFGGRYVPNFSYVFACYGGTNFVQLDTPSGRAEFELDQHYLRINDERIATNCTNISTLRRSELFFFKDPHRVAGDTKLYGAQLELGEACYSFIPVFSLVRGEYGLYCPQNEQFYGSANNHRLRGG